MELSQLAVIFAMFATCLELVSTKSTTIIVNDPKRRLSQKLNAVSSTTKPDFSYHSLNNQYQSMQPDRQYQHQNHLPSITQNLQQHQVNLQQLQAPVQLNAQSQQQILQLIQRALYSTQQHNQPTAMIIIAQPAFVPANVLYGGQSGQTQHLLNYFHSNPQARYQLLHGTTQQQSPSQRFTPPTPSHNSGSYQTIPAPQQPQEIFNALPAPQQHEEIPNSLPTPLPLITHMSPVQPAENYLQQTPLRLSQVSHFADMTSQQYSNPSQQYSHNSHPSGQFSHSSQQYSFPSNQFQFDMESRQNNQGAPVRSLPPIITGFENFSPEQQEKIKAQLSVQFGAPLQPLPVGQNSENGSGEQQNEKNGQYQPKYQFGASSFGQNQERDSGVGQFSPKYQTISTRLNIDEFVPSQQLKNNVGSSSIMHVPKSSYKKM